MRFHRKKMEPVRLSSFAVVVSSAISRFCSSIEIGTEEKLLLENIFLVVFLSFFGCASPRNESNAALTDLLRFFFSILETMFSASSVKKTNAFSIVGRFGMFLDQQLVMKLRRALGHFQGMEGRSFPTKTNR